MSPAALSRFERPRTSERRVVVTGMGLLSPLGLDLNTSWEALLEGRSGIAPITLFDASSFEVRFAGEVKGFDPTPWIDKKSQKKLARFSQLTVAAADMALRDSGLELSDALRETTGSLVGVGIGGLGELQDGFRTLLERGPSRISPFLIPSVISNMASGHVSIRWGLRGPNYAVTSACASGANAIGEGARYIRDGLANVMVVGGAESAICEIGIGGFAAMKALSTRNEAPSMASRPFDRDRDGFVMAEGAGVLILEDYEHAEKRGARIYGEVAGYGVSSDAFHMTNPISEGTGAASAMRRALASARVSPDQIGYINAHGTSTPAGDGAETTAIKVAFGEAARRTWISSTKSQMGHSLGAAGAIESIFSLMTLVTGDVPPTINLENTSADCDLDYVPLVARHGKFSYVLNNSFGFGGTNASLLFSAI